MSRPGIVLSEPMALPEHELLARIFRVLGDATRLRVLEHLLGTETAWQVELVEKLGVSQSRMSEHVSCLVWCGFVSMKRDGRRVHYQLADSQAEQFIGLARRFLYGNPDAVGGCTPVEDGKRREPAQVYGVL